MCVCVYRHYEISSTKIEIFARRLIDIQVPMNPSQSRALIFSLSLALAFLAVAKIPKINLNLIKPYFYMCVHICVRLYMPMNYPNDENSLSYNEIIRKCMITHLAYRIRYFEPQHKHPSI